MIAASLVKELRERSGAGFMDCKNALNETNGNIEKAIEFLMKSGAAKAQKKAADEGSPGTFMLIGFKDFLPEISIIFFLCIEIFCVACFNYAIVSVCFSIALICSTFEACPPSPPPPNKFVKIVKAVP